MVPLEFSGSSSVGPKKVVRAVILFFYQYSGISIMGP